MWVHFFFNFNFLLLFNYSCVHFLPIPPYFSVNTQAALCIPEYRILKFNQQGVENSIWSGRWGGKVQRANRTHCSTAFYTGAWTSADWVSLGSRNQCPNDGEGGLQLSLGMSKKLYSNFSCAGGSAPSPCIVQGSTVLF